MSVRILIDRDRTNKIRLGDDSPDIVAVFRPSGQTGSHARPTLYRVIDGKELRDIVHTGKVRGGLFATPDERKHGASWAHDALRVAKWGRQWRGRLGAELYVLELDATGKTFYHMGPVTRPGFDPFGRALQPVTMELTECETGLGCSVASVSFDEVNVYRVKPKSSALLPMTREAVVTFARRKKAKAVELKHHHGKYSTGWIHGHSVSLHKRVPQIDRAIEEGRAFTIFEWPRSPLPEHRRPQRPTWEVLLRELDGNERLIVIGKPTRKAAIDAAEKLLRRRSAR